MTIVDRYLLISFFKIFMICLISFMGLFIVIHLFTNLDELVELGEKNGGLANMMFEFYGPRVLDLFNKMAGVLVLISAIFSLSMMQRKGEMTAIEAAGISKSRLARPIFLAAVFVLGLSVVNREVWIPTVKDRLVRTVQNWQNTGSVPMNFQKDPRSGILIRGDQLIIDKEMISNPEIQIPVHMNSAVSSIRAKWGKVVSATQRRPAGLILQNVTAPDNISAVPSMHNDEGETVIFTPRDYSWLKPTQCFVACDLNVQEMAFGKQLSGYATLREMMASLRKPRLWFKHGQQVQVHARVLQPVLDLTIVLLGLPLVISKADRNIFTAAGFCLLVVIGVQLTVLGCHSLGTYSLIKPAALAAWLPVIVFLPLAVLSMRLLKG